MTKTLLAATAALAMMANAASADTYTYACQVKDDATDNTHLYSAKVDTRKRTITFRGVTYGNLEHTDCGKAGFRATRRNGVAELCAATQGVADLTLTSGTVGNDGVDEFECDLVR